MKKDWRGFGSISAEKHKELSSQGGRAAHDKHQINEWTPAEGRRVRLAALERENKKRTNYRSRKHNGRYEYYVPDIGWISRERVRQLRAKGAIA